MSQAARSVAMKADLDRPKKGAQRILTAFERIWDRTEEHADAVARIISALDNLRP
jgi:hypothetical protein